MSILGIIAGVAVVAGITAVVVRKKKRETRAQNESFHVCRQCEHPYSYPNIPRYCRRCGGPVDRPE